MLIRQTITSYGWSFWKCGDLYNHIYIINCVQCLKVNFASFKVPFKLISVSWPYNVSKHFRNPVLQSSKFYVVLSNQNFTAQVIQFVIFCTDFELSEDGFCDVCTRLKVYFTYGGDDGSSEEESAAEIPVARVIGRVSNGTHSSADRVYCMLGKDAHAEKDSNGHFGSTTIRPISPRHTEMCARCRSFSEY